MILFKKWIIKFSIVIVCMIFFVGLLNYIFDPYWCFSHDNLFTRKQKGFDERQQKTNRITYQSRKYDGLLIGDSIASFINQNDFAGLRVFNFGLSGGSLNEYGEYIEYAKKRNDSSFKYIFLEINLSSEFADIPDTIQSPTFYIQKSKEFLYRYRILFEGHTLKQSIKNFRILLGDSGDDFYDRNNVRSFRRISKKESEAIFRMVLSDPLKYGKIKHFSIIDTLQLIKKNNPETKIIAFIPPHSYLLFKERYLKAIGIKHYANLLKDCISVLDSLYTFMYPNSITLDTNNFYDLGHFYPHVGTLIAYRIAGIDDKKLPSDFGILLDKKNVDSHIAHLQHQLQTIPISNPFL